MRARAEYARVILLARAAPTITCPIMLAPNKYASIFAHLTNLDLNEELLER